MLIQYLIAGFVSALTPTLFFMLLFVIIAFNNFKMTKKQDLINIAGFSLIIIGLYSLIGLLVSKYSIDIFSILDSRIRFRVSFIILKIVFGLWILGVIKIKTENRALKQALRVMIVILIGVTFIFSTLPSLGPILGAIMVASISEESTSSMILSLVIFSVGLIVPTSLILIIASRLVNRLNDSRWWKIIQISFGCFYILFSAY